MMNKTAFTKALYKSVDSRDSEQLSAFITEDVHFCIGNYPPVIGQEAVLAANQAFFASIQGMQHRLDNIWECGDSIICNGNVDYVRLDGSEYSVGFATVLKMQGDKISDYLVYVDISEL